MTFYCVFPGRCADESAHKDFKRHCGAQLVLFNREESALIVLVSRKRFGMTQEFGVNVMVKLLIPKLVNDLAYEKTSLTATYAAF